jgi:hypothetical protein
MSTDLEVQDKRSAAIVQAEYLPAATPMTLIERASARGASLEEMKELFKFRLEVERDEARKAFNAAFSAFKAEGIRILKNITVAAGPLKDKKYADLFCVVDAITPPLSKYQLNASWKTTRDDPEWIEVTCMIRHTLGHFETEAMGAAPDTGPGRNAIQARGSTRTYLQRYTLLAITGLAAAGTDSDGVTPSIRLMPEEKLQECLDAIKECPPERLASLLKEVRACAAYYKCDLSQVEIDKAVLRGILNLPALEKFYRSRGAHWDQAGNHQAVKALGEIYEQRKAEIGGQE